MTFYYPYIKERYKSLFIDTLVIVGLMVLISIILSFFNEVAVEVKIACTSLLFLYEPICISVGATIGQASNKIRVRNNTNPTKKLNIFLALWRTAIKYVLGIISILFIHGNQKRRAIHDYLANSVVISLDAIHFEPEKEISGEVDENINIEKENDTYF